MSTSTITLDQLRNREIVAADLLTAATESQGAHATIITAPGGPLSVFGRKMAGHGS